MRLRRSLTVVLAVVLVVPAAVGAAGAGVGGDASAEVEADASPFLQPRGSILIDSETGPTGFILGHDPQTGEPIHNTAMGVRGGSGTAEDPYVISNWTVYHTDPSFGIQLVNTSAHVVIENVSIPGEPVALNGIRLFDASNVTVENVHVRRATTEEVVRSPDENGIHVRDSEDVRIDTVLLGPSRALTMVAFQRGVWVEDSRGVALGNVSVKAAAWPMRIDGSENVSVVDSNVRRNPDEFFTALPIRQTSNLTFARNFVRDVRVEASQDDVFEPAEFEDLVFAGNRINGSGITLAGGLIEGQDTQVGLSLEARINGLDVCGNVVRHIQDVGLDLGFGLNNTVRGNVIEDTVRIGIQVDAPKTLMLRNRIESSSDPLESLSENLSMHENDLPKEHHGAATFLEDANASRNWWGHPDGPRIVGEEDPGNGTLVWMGDDDEVSFANPLAEPPETGPDAVDCGVPIEGRAGVKQRPDMVLPWGAEAGLEGQLNESVAGVHPKVSQRTNAGVQ